MLSVPTDDGKNFNRSPTSPGMERTRRGLLATGGAGLRVALAGCGSGGDPQETTDGDGDDGDGDGEPTPTPTPDPAPNLSFDGFELLEPDDHLVVAVTVVNDGDETGAATLEVYVRVGEEETTRRRQVALDAGEAETYRFEFDSFTRQQAFEDGSVDPRFRPAEGE